MDRAFTIIELAIVICIVALLTAIAVPNFLEAEQRADVASVKEDQKRVSIALATYKLDHANYPFHWPFTSAPGYVAQPGIVRNINKAMADATPEYDGQEYQTLPSFAAPFIPGQAIGLTTPVAYLPKYVKDDFSYAYYYTATFQFVAAPKEYLLWSWGPDGEDQLDGGGFIGSNHNAAEYIVRGGQPLPTSYLTAGPLARQAPAGAPTSGPAFTYDPTNGTGSTGDIWRVANGAS